MVDSIKNLVILVSEPIKNKKKRKKESQKEKNIKYGDGHRELTGVKQNSTQRRHQKRKGGITVNRSSCWIWTKKDPVGVNHRRKGTKGGAILTKKRGGGLSTPPCHDGKGQDLVGKNRTPDQRPQKKKSLEEKRRKENKTMGKKRVQTSERSCNGRGVRGGKVGGAIYQRNNKPIENERFRQWGRKKMRKGASLPMQGRKRKLRTGWEKKQKECPCKVPWAKGTSGPCIFVFEKGGGKDVIISSTWKEKKKGGKNRGKTISGIGGLWNIHI